MTDIERTAPQSVWRALSPLINRLRRFVARHLFLRDVAILTGGSVVAQALPVLFTPVLTRLYTPADIGVLGIFTSFINFAAGAATLGYSLAVISAKDDDEGAILTALSTLVVLPMAVMQTLGLVLLDRAQIFGLDQLPSWSLIAMVPALMLTGIYSSLRYWMIRIGDFRGISTATIAQSVGRLLVQLASGLLGFAGAGLITGEVLGRTAGLRRMFVVSRNGLIPRLERIGLRQLRATAIAYRKFPLYSAPSLVLNGIALALPVPLVAAYFSISLAGQYAVATRVMILPSSLIGFSVSDVFHRRIAEISRTSPDRAVRFLVRAFIGLFAIALLPAAVITFGGERLFTAILGQDWTMTGALAAAVVPWVVMQFCVSPLNRVAQVYQGQESELVYNVLHIANVAGVMSLGHAQGWSLVNTVSVLSWVQAAIYVIYLVLLINVVRRHININAISSQNSADE